MSTITRGEFAVLLAERLGLDVSGSGAFADTNGTPYDGAVAALKKAGITTGTSTSKFSPYEVITREQVATFVGRAYDISRSGASVFGDVPTGHWANDYLNGLNDAGIFQGVGGGDFGLGQAFNFDHWSIVEERLDGYTASSEPVGPSTPAIDPIGTPSVSPSPIPVDDPPDEVDVPVDADSYAWAEGYLEQYFDLPGMGDWIVQMVEQYGSALSNTIIDMEIRKTAQFQERYGVVMDARREAGLPAISAADILNFERTAAATMRASGLPKSFYDSRDDFHQLLIADVSVAELQERIAVGFERVAQAPLSVRQAYADYFGPSGDENLAAYLLDPDKAIPILEREVTTAEIGGAARDFGIDLTSQRAEQLAGYNVDRSLAFTGFARLAALEPLFQETAGERVDLTAESEGIDSQFLSDADATRALERRAAQRQAGTQGGGGAIVDQTGVIGLGSANSG